MKNLKCIIVLSLLFTACHDINVSSIPNYPVYLHVNLTTTYPTFKNSINQYILIEKPVLASDRVGYGGIFICSGFDGTYYAFDMACPYEANNNTKVKPPLLESDYMSRVTCEKCGSVYELGYGYGNPVAGPSKEGLKRYRLVTTNDIIYITN